jgi:uncharacterized protein (DUF1015 family)
MATIRPFRAERPSSDKAAVVSSVPYDVVSVDEARQLAAGNPLSFLHVSRAEIDLANGTDVYSDVVYAKAAENYAKLRANAPLSTEDKPSIYIYQLKMGTHIQSGIACCCSLDEYENDTIRKHERTRKDKEDDRTRHMVTIGAQTGPVFLTYKGRDSINDAVNRVKSQNPLCEFTAADGVSHTIWKAADSDAAAIVEEFNSVPLLYIADGHHRAASAGRARTQLKQANPNHNGSEDYNYFLTVLFPADQVQILAYNRVVKDLNGMSVNEFVEALAAKFEINPAVEATPTRKGEICMYLNGRWRSLTLPPAVTATVDPIKSLDVSRLQDRILDELLGIKDIRTDKRVDFVGGIRGTGTLEEMVNDGRFSVAFSMYPVTVEELMAIADANQIMPPKSTWFEPKLRDGLLSHLIA